MLDSEPRRVLKSLNFSCSTSSQPGPDFFSYNVGNVLHGVVKYGGNGSG